MNTEHNSMFNHIIQILHEKGSINIFELAENLTDPNDKVIQEIVENIYLAEMLGLINISEDKTMQLMSAEEDQPNALSNTISRASLIAEAEDQQYFLEEEEEEEEEGVEFKDSLTYMQIKARSELLVQQIKNRIAERTGDSSFKDL